MNKKDHAAHVDVHIEGDVSGQIAIGDNILQIGDVHGGVVNIIQPGKKPTFSQRPRPVMVRPHKFPGFLDHESEFGTAMGALNAGESVSVYAGNGMGKTTLLRHLAYHAPGDNYPDGILYFPARIKNVDDLLQIIFDHFFESDSPAKPTDAELRQFLQGVEALILLDDALLNNDEVLELINAVPQSAFILASSERCLWGEGCCIELTGLPLQDALVLIERELQRKLTQAEQASAESLHRLGSGQPLFLLQAAALVRDGKSFKEIVNAFHVSEGGIGKMIAEKLSEAQQSILGLMESFKDVAIPREHLAQLTNTKDIKTQLQTLKDLRLIQERGSEFSLAGALALPMREAITPDWEVRGLDYFTAWIGKAPALTEIKEVLDLLLSLIQRAFLSGRWDAVITLGRGIERTLILNGLWRTWLQVLQWIIDAASSLRDPSTQAWALHQLGTRSLCLGDLSTAQTLLTQALGIRETIGDQAGAEATRQSRGLTSTPPPPPTEIPPAQTATIPGGGLSPLLKAALIAGGTVVLAASTLIFVTSRSPRLLPAPPASEVPVSVIQTPLEVPATAASTETLEPTAIAVTEVTPQPLECTGDLDFVSAVALQYEVSICFDAPFAIPYESMDSIYNVDLGKKLTVYVNSNEISGYQTGLYAPNQPNRLFILIPEFHQYDTIQVHLMNADTLYCSQIVSVDWIDPYIPPTATKPPKPVCTLTSASCSPDYFCAKTCTCVASAVMCPP
jgi:hypothetical protein